jgi:hypothetical protein
MIAMNEDYNIKAKIKYIIMNNDIKITTGNLEVIGNGNIHIAFDRIFTIHIKDKVQVEFIFVENKEQSEDSIEANVVNDKLTLTLINYSNPLGMGVLEPMEIGILENKKLFLSFFIWHPNKEKGNRIINYVLYTEENN